VAAAAAMIEMYVVNAHILIESVWARLLLLVLLSYT